LAFGTEAAKIGGMVFITRDFDDFLAVSFQHHAAAYTAVRAY
jgi:hypothetical protein